MELKKRKVARVLLLNDKDEVLLVRHTVDMAAPNPDDIHAKNYWLPPGGGLEPNESFEEGARRELMEETGIEIACVEQRLLTRDFESIYDGKPVLIETQIFFARTGGRSSPKHNNVMLDEAIAEVKWWPISEINSSSESFFPAMIADLLRKELE